MLWYDIEGTLFKESHDVHLLLDGVLLPIEGLITPLHGVMHACIHAYVPCVCIHTYTYAYIYLLHVHDVCACIISPCPKDSM